MFRPKLQRTVQVNLALMGVILLSVSIAAAAQTTAPLTPAQQKAQAARQARQAAAQQATADRAAAAQARTSAAQNKAAAKPNATTPTAPLTNAANTATTPRPGSTSGVTTPTAAQRTTGAGTVGSGTLAWQTRVYSSNGCQHNGNSAVCTFTFSNQGNEATLVAGSEMSGIQLVDDAHVPHHANAAHFLDKYGTQQPRLLVQSGVTGTYVLTFPDVNSQVASGDFHLRQQIVGGVTFNSSSTAAMAAPGTTGAPAKPLAGPAGVAPK